MALDWECVNWDTPISNAESVKIEAVCRDGEIVITADTSTFGSRGEVWAFVFTKVPAYRSVQETYRSDLFARIDRKAVGRTLAIENSPFVRELAANDEVFAELCRDVEHYVILSDVEVLEVLSNYPPQITRVR